MYDVHDLARRSVGETDALILVHIFFAGPIGRAIDSDHGDFVRTSAGVGIG